MKRNPNKRSVVRVRGSTNRLQGHPSLPARPQQRVPEVTRPPSNPETNVPPTPPYTSSLGHREPRHGSTPPPPAHCSGFLHTVVSGDTLFRLAMAQGVTLEAIIASNPQISNPDSLVPGQVVCVPSRQDSRMEILNALLTAEKVETALYAQGLKSPALQGLEPSDMAYFQAGLSAEISHVAVLTDLGASAPFTEFFFPPGTFEDRSVFLNTLLSLEMAGIAAYIQASFEFARMGQFDISRLMDRIMGVEAEHRALIRDVLGRVPADNLCFENAPNEPVTVILAALPNFLRPGQFEGASEGPIPLPTPEEAAELIGPNSCANPSPNM